jgi:hypothetical protein
LALALAAAAGCGGADKRQKVIVKGAVTVDGKPTGGVTLGFYSPGEKVAVGNVTTQDDGSYEVMFLSHAGEGNYKVTATKIQGKTGGKMPTAGEGMDSFQMGLAAGSGNSAATNLIADRYSTVEKTDLTTVLQFGPNDGKNFNLKAK